MPTLYHSLVLLTDAALKPRAPRLPCPDLQVPAMHTRKRARSPPPQLDKLAQLADFTEDLLSRDVSEDEVSEAELALAEQLLAPSPSAHMRSLSNSSSDTNLAAGCPPLGHLLDGLITSSISSAAARDQPVAARQASAQSSQGFLADADLLQGHDAQPLLNRSYASAQQPFPSPSDDSPWDGRPASYAGSADCHANEAEPAAYSGRQQQQDCVLRPGVSPLQQRILQQLHPGLGPALPALPQRSRPAVNEPHSQHRQQAGQALQHFSSAALGDDEQEQLLVPNPLAANLHHWSVGEPFDVPANEPELASNIVSPSDNTY